MLEVAIFGAAKYAVRIELDPRALTARGIGLDEVNAAVRSANANLPTGLVEGRDRAYTVEATGGLMDAAEFRDVTVAFRDGAPVKLRDVANVRDGVENENEASWFVEGGRDQRNLTIAVRRQPGTNTVEIAEKVRALLPSIEKQLPAAAELKVLYDRSVSIQRSVDDVQFTLLLTLGLVVLVRARNPNREHRRVTPIGGATKDLFQFLLRGGLLLLVVGEPLRRVKVGLKLVVLEKRSAVLDPTCDVRVELIADGVVDVTLSDRVVACAHAYDVEAVLLASFPKRVVNLRADFAVAIYNDEGALVRFALGLNDSNDVSNMAFGRKAEHRGERKLFEPSTGREPALVVRARRPRGRRGRPGAGCRRPRNPA